MQIPRGSCNSQTLTYSGCAAVHGVSLGGPVKGPPGHVGQGIGVEIFLLDRAGQAAWTQHYRELLWRATVSRDDSAHAGSTPRHSWQQEGTLAR